MLRCLARRDGALDFLSFVHRIGVSFDALSRFDAWIEPAIVAEWMRLTHGYAQTQMRTLDAGAIVKAMQWSDPERVITEARQRALANMESGRISHCVWSGTRLTKDRLDIDHCFPWKSWPCDDLWNLLPSTRTVNQHQKRERPPSAIVLKEARELVLEWWKAGYLEVNTVTADRFYLEARSSLPLANAFASSIAAGDVFDAVAFQRMRLKENRQIPEWTL